MTTRIATTRDMSLLSAAIVLGAIVSPLLSFIGLPLAAAGIAGLAYRNRTVVAAIATAIGVAGVGVISRTDLIFVGPSLLAIVLAVILLPRFDVQLVGAGLIAVIAVFAGLRDYVVMTLAHQTPATAVKELLALGGTPATGSAASSAKALSDMTNLLVSLFPAMAFLTGFILGIAVIAAISWTAHRCDRVVKVPTLACLDLTPHVLWPFVIGVFSLAASYSPLAVAPTLQVVGLNLFVGSVAFFALQGLAVGAGALDRFGVRPGFRGVALVALAIIDVFTRVISFIGLLDFWVNFRRLPRDGATPPSAEPVVSDS